MKKYILLFITAFVVIIFSVKIEADLFIGNSSHSCFDNGIDVLIKLDSNKTLSDTIYYEPYNYFKYQK